jgi:hypothetical protein
MLAGEALAAVETNEKQLKGLLNRLEDVCAQSEGRQCCP